MPNIIYYEEIRIEGLQMNDVCEVISSTTGRDYLHLLKSSYPSFDFLENLENHFKDPGFLNFLVGVLENPE